MSASEPPGPRRRRELSEEERTLWHGIARSIKPLRRRGKRAVLDAAVETVAVPLPAPLKAKALKPAKTIAAPVRPPQPAGPPPLAPLARREKQKLARGSAAIDARIDLHGMTQARAHAALARFLRRAQDDDARFVLVITGKGVRAADGERGVLRRQVPLWLGLPELRDVVVGFEEAHATHGGEGALYVRLRRGHGN
jgi:DNA-nicking Smr family endonuclease